MRFHRQFYRPVENAASVALLPLLPLIRPRQTLSAALTPSSSTWPVLPAVPSPHSAPGPRPWHTPAEPLGRASLRFPAVAPCEPANGNYARPNPAIHSIARHPRPIQTPRVFVCLSLRDADRLPPTTTILARAAR